MASLCMKRVATDDQIKYCTELLDGFSVGHRGVFDGHYFQQLFGLIAQTIIADMSKTGRPVRCLDGPDAGHDLVINGVKIDVKCVLREGAPKVDWACNITSRQINYDCDAYLFVSYEKPAGIFYILGWITKKEFLLKARHNKVGDRIVRDDGTTLLVQGVSFYETPIKHLRRIRDTMDLDRIKKEEP